MINDKLLNLIKIDYKKEVNLQQQYNTNTTKLTADNFNAVLSAIIELNNYDDVLENLFNEKINETSTNLTNRISAGDARIQAMLEQLSADYNTNKHKVDSAKTATSADIAKKVQHTLTIKTNTNTTQTFNGSSNVLINTILSSIYALSATNATQSTHALSADTAISATNALSSKYSQQSIHASNSDTALSAGEANVANSTAGTLLWINTEDYDVQQFDGSSDVILSSVLFSVSATYANQTNVAFSAQYDYYGDQLNTKILYSTTSENEDYPLLFSENNNTTTYESQKYGAHFHENIVVNPYLGAIKANYFIGTAISATHAVCDQNSIILNTRVCQNQTSNNYDYPILLAFMSQQTDGIHPENAKNNEVLYTSTLTLNPYTNIIHSQNPNQFTSDLQHTPTIKTDKEITNFINTKTAYDVNFQGLATRAVCDRDGNQLGRKIFITPDNDNTPSERPLLFASTVSRTATQQARDNVGYCAKIFVNTSEGNITANKFIGVATSAQWADLAEKYQTDTTYQVGTLICFGGQKEITIATNEVNGVISDQPAYLMNSKCIGQPIALVGRVPVRIKGKVNKFDYIILSNQPGIGISNGRVKTQNIIGRALKDKLTDDIDLLQCTVQLSL